MSTDLTNRQQQTLQFILNSIQRNGFPPTVREIKKALRVNSIRGAIVHLEALKKKGYITRSRQARGIKVLKTPTDKKTKGNIKIPLLGQIAAGKPLLAQENIEKYVSIKREYLHGNENAFLLRVQGESMIEAGILPGDLAIVSPVSTAENGEVVVALLEDAATLKKFHRVENYVALLPANPEYEPIIGQEFSIQGKVIGVVRESEKPYGSVMKDGALLPIYKIRIREEQEGTNSRWVYGASA